MKPIVRPSKLADLDAFVSMKQEYLEDFTRISGEKLYISKKQIKDEFLETLQKRNSNIFILEVNTLICGFIKMNIIKNKTRNLSYLEDMFVKSNNQGKGYGRLLFDTFIQLSKDKKVEKMGLGTRIENERAISMYKKYGFEIIGYNFGKKLVY